MRSEADPGGDRRDQVETARFLRGISLFADLSADELEELVAAMRSIELERGGALWRQGDEADGLHVVCEGTVRVLLREPGGGELELARLGPGEVLGEVPLLDGGRRSATARLDGPGRLLFLSRLDFAALTARRHPTAFAVRRRICAVVCARLRRTYATLADSLGPSPHPAVAADATGAGDPPFEPRPDYLRRLAFFGGFAEFDLAELRARSRLEFFPPKRVLVREGDRPDACYVTVNGAVEEVIDRGEKQIPVALAGPGRAFAYMGLIDGEPTPLTAVTRERALLLVIPRSLFEAYFRGATSTSYALFAGVERDLMAALRRTDAGFARQHRERSQARPV